MNTLPKSLLSRLRHKSSRSGLALWLEIGIVLLLKIAALFILWKLSFSQPKTKKMALPVSVMEQHLLPPAVANSPLRSHTNPAITSPQKSQKNDTDKAHHESD